MSNELKLCPFCGSLPKTLKLNGATQVQCSADFEACAGADVLAPVDMWNRRVETATISRLSEEVERLAAAVEHYKREAQGRLASIAIVTGERDAALARVKVLEETGMWEAERLRLVATEAETAISEFYRYWTGGETRGSYDGKPERNSLWKAMYALRAALHHKEG